MSFVKKALKKVWKVTKKVVKSKIFKYVAIAAAIFFTAGVAAGGFAAFGAAAGNVGISGFFTAVGQTMATGAAAMAGGIGLTSASTSLAGYGGQAAVAAGLTGAPAALGAGVTLSGATTAGIGSSTTSIIGSGLTAEELAVQTAIEIGTTAGADAAAVAAGTSVAPGAGFFETVKSVLGTEVLGDVTAGQLLTNAAMAGVSAVIAKKDKEDRFPNSYVAGDLARGGGPDAPAPFHFTSGEAAPSEAGFSSSAEQLASTQSVAGAQAQEGLVPQEGAPIAPDPFVQAREGIAGIKARLASRDEPAPEERPALIPQAPPEQGQESLPTGGYELFSNEATKINLAGVA